VKEVLSGQTPEATARASGVCPRTVRKWVARFKAEGAEGLKDRSSRPRRLHRPTPIAIVERVEAMRRQRWTGKQIAAEGGVSPATVSRILNRLGLNRLAALEPAEPVRRYEREHLGELIGQLSGASDLLSQPIRGGRRESRPTDSRSHEDRMRLLTPMSGTISRLLRFSGKPAAPRPLVGREREPPRVTQRNSGGGSFLSVVQSGSPSKTVGGLFRLAAKQARPKPSTVLETI
jgi:transposase-like protein